MLGGHTVILDENPPRRRVSFPESITKPARVAPAPPLPASSVPVHTIPANAPPRWGSMRPAGDVFTRPRLHRARLPRARRLRVLNVQNRKALGNLQGVNLASPLGLIAFYGLAGTVNALRRIVLRL